MSLNLIIESYKKNLKTPKIYSKLIKDYNKKTDHLLF